jgi:hypothetical protein
MTDAFVDEYNSRQTREATKLAGIFMAVSRNSMRLYTRDSNVTAMSQYNWEALNQRSPQNGEGEASGHIIQKPAHSLRKANESTVFECGEVWMHQWYQTQTGVPEDYYGSILPSILNFYLASHAEVFVGVDQSSWSADVWTTRYYLGKGASNFKYTPNGIYQVPNNGLPSNHISCRKMINSDGTE